MAITITGVQRKDRNTIESVPGTVVAVRATATAAAVAPVATGTSPGTTITHGRQISAANTGIAGAGVSQSSLTTVAGNVTYSTAGQTISNKLFNGTIHVTANNVTFQNCMFTAYGASTFQLQVDGDNCSVNYCTFLPPSGHSAYEGIITGANGLTVTRCDISYAENCITLGGGSNHNIIECFLHDPYSPDNPSGHNDIIEVYGGSTVNILRSKLTMTATETAPVNCAPWAGSTSVSNLTVADNYIDGGIYHILVDLQSTGTITYTRVKRNDMGGHTYPGYSTYWALANLDSRPVVETESALSSQPSGILWPTSGPDVNYWVNCSDLTPDKTGQIIIP